VGAARAADSVEAALREIRRQIPRVTVLVCDLPEPDVWALVKALPDPLAVVAIVPERAPHLNARLAEAGVAVQIPETVPAATLRPVLERIRLRTFTDEAERLRQVLAAVSHARHELNNPLTSILAEAQLLEMDASALPAEAQKSVRTIHEMAVRIRDVVRSLQNLREAP
jgi:signal transduction histidine kinase